MAQYHVQFTVGLGVDGGGFAISDHRRPVIIDLLKRFLSDQDVSFTLTQGTGHWVNDKGLSAVEEPVVVFTSDMWTSMANLHYIAQRLSDIAYQECVHVSATETYAVNVDYHGKIDDGS